MEAHTPLITQPIFLVGAERSGTTVLRLMLDHHPQLAWCNEFEYVVDRITASNGWPELEEYYKWLETHRIFQATGFTIDRSLNYPQLVNSFLCQKREARGKSLVGATVHRHFDQLLKIWPDARFIHLIRDGRDVARSCIPMGWAGNVWTGAERWLKAESLWTQLCQKLPAEQQIEITYEDLISNPINNLTRLCEFIGIPFDLAMLSYPQKTSYDFPNPNLICQWKSKMSKREIQLVESRISTMLLERGYQLSGLPLLTITSTMERRLNRQDWWFRVWFRVQKFGLLLFLSDYFSRKFGLIHWQKRIQLQLNEIVKAHLK